MRTVFILALLLLRGNSGSLSASEAVWEELSPLPEGRSGMIAFLTEKHEPAFLGGSSWEGGVKRTHSSGYALRENEWRPIAGLPFPIAYAAVARSLGGVTASGGTDGEDINPQRVILKPNLRLQFEALPPAQTRIYAGAAELNGNLFLVGGATRLSPLAPTDSISRLTNGVWTDLGPLPEGPLINPAVAAWDERIFVFGGGIPGSNGLTNTDSVYAYDPNTRTARGRSSLPFPARGVVAVTLPEIGLLLIGGYTDSGDFSSQPLLYHPEKDAFTPLTTLPVGLMLPGVLVAGQQVYVFGGEDAPRSRSRRVFLANLSRLIQY